eukprot:TRINITY_DN5076_c0_g1_i2.p1 TRINITY_DN5076_c0_g1~~TRINITY_DN5076_c0_g1_i2.p1  ORF type:complete len:262 (-),score=35.64 TRINITY_DN5076_c0_g1_i2:8-793(-)
MNVTNDCKDLMGVGMVVPTPGMAQEDYTKKIRKPYTITKSRESWTEQEHEKFLQALHLYDRDWKKIEQYVGTKTVIQIRSHAQKYFLKVQKNGTGEHVPPPRPKRKSAQPYPQKAPKTVLVPSASAKVNAASGGNGQSRPDGNTGGPWAKQPPAPGPPPKQEAPPRAALPDFAVVYRFIGGVFDPGVTGHLRRLKEMAPFDRRTTIQLMANMSLNLSAPGFDVHKLLSSVYDRDGVGLDGAGDPGMPSPSVLPTMPTVSCP